MGVARCLILYVAILVESVILWCWFDDLSISKETLVLFIATGGDWQWMMVIRSDLQCWAVTDGDVVECYGRR